MNRASLKTQYEYQHDFQGYASNPIEHDAEIIDGYFRKENTEKEMAIKKVNKTLSTILMGMILVALFGYYFAMSSELTLNTLSRQITTLNDENAELQHEYDRLKSFNNVDMSVSKNNILQKADKVIEVEAVEQTARVLPKQNNSKKFSWTIGY